jgi:ATP-dependent DNA helicase RecG
MGATSKFEPRKMMEKAIDAMKQSINEPRVDEKASPLVGAVLLKPDGTVESAHRGELREGDHAEFTLLERKNRASKLDGSTLFATLEPCAPGARNHPKLSCAERIVNARIKEVWVGITDPDPTVDRKGIQFLQDHGVTVHMFDHDLQEEIQAVNQEFIAQALERKAAVEEQDEITVLSALENPVTTADLQDFSEVVLGRYHSLAKIEDAVDSHGFRRRLAQQGLLTTDGTALVPSGFGMLLFGQSPREGMPQAGLLGTIHWPDGSEEVRDFDGPMLLIPEQAIQWLKDKLPDPIDRSGAQRKDANESFYELVREGIVNALVHRDYTIEGAKCQLVVTPDTITISSPGYPVKPIELKQLQGFNAPMLSRNPVLHYVFAKMELAEERGLGLKSLKTSASDAGLPLPTYAWEDPYLVLTLYRSGKGAVRALGTNVLERLNADAKDTWQVILLKQPMTSSEVMTEMGFDERKSQRVLRKLMDEGLVHRIGKGRATQYVAANP